MKASVAWLVSAVCMVGLASSGLAACGDDDGGGPHDAGADSGGSGGSGEPDGGGGTGGTGGTGGAGDAGGLTKAECLDMSVQQVPAACLDCACGAAPDETAQCGADCWSLLVCVAVTCEGDLEDLDCITNECSEWATGAAQAMAMIASPVVAQCMQACTVVEGDGGTEDGGS